MKSAPKLRKYDEASSAPPEDGLNVVDSTGQRAQVVTIDGQKMVRYRDGLKFVTMPWDGTTWKMQAERLMAPAQVSGVVYAAISAMRRTNGRLLPSWEELQPRDRERFIRLGPKTLPSATPREFRLWDAMTEALNAGHDS